jgi:hypothetical protein
MRNVTVPVRIEVHDTDPGWDPRLPTTELRQLTNRERCLLNRARELTILAPYALKAPGETADHAGSPLELPSYVPGQGPEPTKRAR